MLTTNIYQFNFAHYEWACGQNILKRESYTGKVSSCGLFSTNPQSVFAHYREVLEVDHHHHKTTLAAIISKQHTKPVPNICHVEYMSVLSQNEFFLKQ